MKRQRPRNRDLLNIGVGYGKQLFQQIYVDFDNGLSFSYLIGEVSYLIGEVDRDLF